MKIGFIGVGNIGGPMCRNVIKKSGAEVSVFDLSEAAVQGCVDVGGKAASSIADAVRDADVILSSLPHPRDVEAVGLGSGGIGANAKSGAVYFDLTTNSPTVAKRVAADLKGNGVNMLDAPVSGGVVGAEKGTLAVMVGGDKAALEQHQSVLECFGQNIVYTGELGTGCIAKIVNNMVAFCNMAAGAEGLLLGAIAGIDPDVLNQVIRNSSGNSMTYRGVAKKTLTGDWSAHFALDLAYKDMHLALELADELNVPLTLSPQVHNLMRMARAMGHGGDDAAALMRVYEKTMNVDVRSKQSR